ncbi:hypothetical protein EAD96_04450 [Micromonospora sp. BL1]|nr:hypothetical protein EAD96_04450 [Micromonospora sp. BL1]
MAPLNPVQMVEEGVPLDVVFTAAVHHTLPGPDDTAMADHANQASMPEYNPLTELSTSPGCSRRWRSCRRIPPPLPADLRASSARYA